MRLKLIILSACVWLSYQASAQLPGWVPYKSKNVLIGLAADSLFYLPFKDTTHTPQRIGAITIRPQDSLLYKGIKTTAGGKRWELFSSGSTGTGQNFGEADTVFTANRYVNQAGYTMSYKSGQSIFGAEKRQIGTRYTHAWSSLTGWTDNTATATVTTDGTGTTISGGAWNLNNYISLNNEVFTSHNYKISQTIVVNSKTSTSYGFGIRILPLAAGQAIFAHFLLSDTAGYISFVSTNQVTITGDANNDAYTKFLWASGDTLDLTLTRAGYDVYVEMKNRTTKSQSKLFIDKIDPTPLGTAPGNISLFTYGGDYKLIDNFKVEYFDTYQPKWLTMGHSINYGADAFTEALKWTSQTFENEGGGWVDVSANSIASIDGTLMMSDILTNIKPQNAIIDFVVNDKQGSVPLDSFSARMTRIITQFQAAGTNPVLVTGILTGSSCVTYNDTIWALASRYNLKVIDAYTAILGSGTDMLPIFNYGDNIHWKQEGHTQVAGTAKSALRALLSSYSPVNLQNTPLSFERKYTLGLDNNGNLVKSLFKGDTSYIRNIGSTLSARNATPGSINIKGNAWIGGTDFRVFGIGTYTSPVLSVNLDGDGYVKASLFKSNGVNFGSSYISLGSDGFNFFMNDIRSYQRPWKIDLNYPNTAGNVGVIFNTTNDDGGGNLQASYKFLSVRNNTVEKAHINRGGGLWLDSLAKYSKNMVSLYDDRTLVDKRYVDSSLSTVGGGMANPMTTTGDIIVGGASGTPTRVGIGTNTQVLTSNGTTASWQNAASGFADPMTTRGDIIIRNAANTTARLAVGANTYVLTSNGIDVSWAAPTGGGITGSGTANMVTKFTGTSAVGDSKIYDNGTNVGIGTTSPSSYLAGQVGLVVYHATPSISITNGSKYFMHYLDAGYLRLYESGVGSIVNYGNSKMGVNKPAPDSTVDIIGSLQVSTNTSINGKLNVKGTAGYQTNINGSLGDNDFITKKYVDSLTNNIVGSSNNSGLTATTSGATYTTPNDGETRIYNIAAKVGITAVSGGTVTTTVTYTDETNTSRTVTFYSMGATTAGLTVTGVSSFPVLGEVVCYPNTTITVTATLSGGTATYNFNSTITYIRNVPT